MLRHTPEGVWRISLADQWKLKHAMARAFLALVLSVLTLSAVIPAAPARADNQGKLKVFVLIGQSNMVGYGSLHARNKTSGDVGTMDFYVKNNPQAYRHLVSDDGSHAVRDDVWVVNFNHRQSKGKTLVKDKGWLTTGFGADENYIGPEYGFGWVLGDHYDEPVLLIKCAWGGRSLAVNFLSPSAGQYPEPKQDGETGYQYAETIRLVKEVLSNLKTYFPAYDGKGYELVGVGWHQGWNDRTKADRVEAYARNMEHFIKDLRKDLGVADLPFVIANTGMNHKPANEQATKLMDDQLSLADPAKYPAFEGNVGAVDTRPFQRKYDKSPSKQGFHWLRNWETYYLIGEGMGRKMVELVNNDSPAN